MNLAQHEDPRYGSPAKVRACIGVPVTNGAARVTSSHELEYNYTCPQTRGYAPVDLIVYVSG